MGSGREGLFWLVVNYGERILLDVQDVRDVVFSRDAAGGGGSRWFGVGSGGLVE